MGSVSYRTASLTCCICSRLSSPLAWPIIFCQPEAGSTVVELQLGSGTKETTCFAQGLGGPQNMIGQPYWSCV